ncbi:MAG: hypothetical protein JO196_21105 [Hyphomicrobiales bacterium]|nr:hypothetical protein [Hyphomicrobiales bacterium]
MKRGSPAIIRKARALSAAEASKDGVAEASETSDAERMNTRNFRAVINLSLSQVDPFGVQRLLETWSQHKAA